MDEKGLVSLDNPSEYFMTEKTRRRIAWFSTFCSERKGLDL